MAPRNIKIENNCIVLCSTNWFRRLPFTKIEKIEPYDEERIATDCSLLCSGGFMGYWGRYSSPQLDTYSACYGDRRQCLLVTMHDGRYYVTGCKNTEALLNLQNDIRQ